VIESVRLKDWVRSALEARAGDPSWTVECSGALDTPLPSRFAAPAVRIAVEQVRVGDGLAEEEATESESPEHAQRARHASIGA
jgi:hypothetical protein